MSRNVLFVHDGPMLYNERQDAYMAVHYNNKIVDRYSVFGDKVSFLMRKKCIDQDEKENYSGIDHPAFHFIEVPNYKSIKAYYKKREAKKIIEKAVQHHDVIIVRLPSANGTIAFHYAKKYNKPILVESVACVFDALWNYNWKGKLQAHFKYYQKRKLMKQATHTIYVTNEFLQSRYPTDGKSIGCSDVVLNEFDEDVVNRRINKIEQRKKEQPLVLGTVAALNVPYKGQADVIKAVGVLKNRGIEVVYKLVGQGDPARLEKTIKEFGVEEHVEIIGPLPHEKVFDFMDEIDVYIQPSRQEGLPRAMVEAMSRACLVTGANTAGIPELIEHKFVFEAGDTNQINSIINSIGGNMMKEQAKRNFNEAKKYRTSVLNQKRKSFYEEFMDDYKINSANR